MEQLLEEVRRLTTQVLELNNRVEALSSQQGPGTPTITEGRLTPTHSEISERPTTPVNQPVPQGPPRPHSPRPSHLVPDHTRQGRPWRDTEFPGYAHEWSKRIGGTAHKHDGQLFVGTCPDCVHINNVASLRCQHPCHGPLPTYSAHWCRWCLQPVWSAAIPDPTSPRVRR